VIFYFISYIPHHFHIIGIIVTETPEDETVEPAETVEAEPGAEFVIEQEGNQVKQLSMIP
jgi:hypothetical protein